MSALLRVVAAVWLSLGSAAAPAAQDAAKSIRAVRVAGEAPRVDGVLDDAAWAEAVVTRDFTQKTPLEGARPSVETEVRFLYDDEALYVGARLLHTEPQAIRRTLTRRDGSSDAERFVVSLDPYRDRRTAYSFGVSAAGARFDLYHPQDAENGEDSSLTPSVSARSPSAAPPPPPE